MDSANCLGEQLSIAQGVSSGDPSGLAHTVSTVRFAALGLRNWDG